VCCHVFPLFRKCSKDIRSYRYLIPHQQQVQNNQNPCS
jgi:hypothetical protein